MTDQINTAANQTATQMAQMANLTGLFDEMQALMTLMPGTIMDRGKPLPTEEETEAMFDNMPV